MKDSKWIGFDAVVHGVHLRIAVSRVTMAFEWHVEPDLAGMHAAKARALAIAEAALIAAGAAPGEQWDVLIEGDEGTARQRI